MHTGYVYYRLLAEQLEDYKPRLLGKFTRKLLGKMLLAERQLKVEF